MPEAGEFDHTAVAVLTKDANGKLQMERHDSTAKHLAWAGAARRFWCLVSASRPVPVPAQ